MNDPQHDLFPPSDFDPWADSYDRDVVENSSFPFAGYEKVISRVVTLAEPGPGMDVLDLGTGTGNIAVRFSASGCNLWCTDFSEAMLAKAREKLPLAHFVLHDIRDNWPSELDRRFARIVSGYVFHHFELEKKVSLCHDLLTNHLASAGRLIVADISFPSLAAKDEFARGITNWEDEFYWLADESIAALNEAGISAAHEQISPCAGIYLMQS